MSIKKIYIPKNKFFNLQIIQGNILNPLFRVGKYSKNEGESETDFCIKSGDVKIVCPGYSKNPITIVEKKLLISLVNHYFISYRNKTFEYSVDNFRKLMGYSDTESNMKECAGRLRKSIEILERCYISVSKEAVKKSKRKELEGLEKLYFLSDVRKNNNGSVSVRKGKVFFSFSEGFINYLSTGGEAYLPDAMMDIKNPIAFDICYELSVAYRICLNKKEKRYIRTIKTLLENCHDIPREEYVNRKMGDKIYEKITQPLFKALSEIDAFEIRLYDDDGNEYEFKDGKYDYFKRVNSENIIDLKIIFIPKENPYQPYKKRG